MELYDQARIVNVIMSQFLTLVNITDSLVPGNDKINILILALPHAGEDAGGFMAEGLIDFLISDDAQAIVARKNFNYMIVPMMNPDGIYHGTSRYNMNMEDLNNVWLNDDKVQPEVSGVKNWVKSGMPMGMRLICLLIFIITPSFTGIMLLFSRTTVLTILVKYWTNTGQSGFIIQHSKNHLAPGYLEKEFQVVLLSYLNPISILS